ncbi:MAG: hypothetical protein PHS37_10225 [Candidatus Omnitrophica bacterium]|nr:hypothetical protein [Candidatus Omnitrophota bacterium]
MTPLRLKERNILVTAVTGSLVWHVACSVLFGISISPESSVRPKYGQINFLGPLLEKTAFEKMVVERHQPGETLDRVPFLIKSEQSLDNTGPVRHEENYVFRNDVKPGAERSLAAPERETALVPVRQGLYYNVGGTDRSIEGPLRDRPILYRPGMPDSVKMLMIEPGVVITRFRIVVSAEGYVTTVVPVLSSGNIKIDTGCAATLKQWRFAPRTGVHGEDAWGLVTLEIKR